DIDKYYGHEGFFYKVNGTEMNCLNCTEDEIEINEDENSDASTTLYYDENGILIKKVINSKKAIEEIKDEIKSEVQKIKVEIN
ncbi:MAG: hypothetical protein ABNG98_09780, partial [Flavobacterium sp.]